MEFYIMLFIILALWLAAETIRSFIEYRIDKKIWNNGISRISGTPWEFVAYIGDGRRYKDSDNNYIWIYWNVDKKKM